MIRNHQHPIGVEQATISGFIAAVHQFPAVDNWLAGGCLPVVF